jgi:phage tail-like protein
MKWNEIKGLLPEVFQRTVQPASPLLALLQVMETLHAPPEDVLEHLDAYFDPYRTPDRFVPFLARWVDLERLLVDAPDAYTPNSLPAFPSGLGRLRLLVASAAELSKWRGTARGLIQFLETATGTLGFKIDEHVPGPDGRPLPFHMRVAAPAAALPHQVLIQRIIEMEKPAYVTYELIFQPGS